MASIDGLSFLPHTAQQSDPSSVLAQGLRHSARMIRLASSGRRRLRHPSMSVREAAAQEIEDRQVDWAYSHTVVAIDAAWNGAFVAAASIAVYVSRSYSPRLPLRLWATGYAVQCVLHAVLVCTEYCRRSSSRRVHDGGSGREGLTGDLQGIHNVESSAIISNLESANTMFSFIWWMIGFYWVCVGGSALLQDSPTLYWLCIVFLVLDFFFVMFCVALASVIAAAVCCCLPCIIAVLYVLADRAGSSKEDIELLPKYTFHQGNEEKIIEESPGPCGGIMVECETNNPVERRLTTEDAECCICLSAYEDGAQLRELPCGHHFHCTCVDKWLYINSTCPLCKYEISKRYSRDGGV